MKIIAFYLPQFHCIQENNLWWGEGFTEWTNTSKAKPKFKGHYQPHIPLNDNYYNLLEDGIKLWQANLAKKYGVYGFCYYHYWFENGKKLLEKPLEQMLCNKAINMPFCLCWANEPWTRNWDGKEKEILMPQNYGNKKDWEKHFYYLLDFFCDDRYICDKSNGCPILLIYKPYCIPNLKEMLDCWDKLAFSSGISKINYIAQYPIPKNIDKSIKEEISHRFIYQIEFEPIYSISRAKDNVLETLLYSPSTLFLFFAYLVNKYLLKKQNKGIHYDYDEIYKLILNRKPLSDKYIPGVFVSWDNTARRGKNSTLYKGSNPEKFQNYLSKQLNRTSKVYKKDFLFINAWNEWAEGAHLEPDKKYGYAYLKALEKALLKNNLSSD